MKISIIDKVIAPIEKFIAKKAELLPFPEEKGFSPVKIAGENFHELSLFSENMPLIGIDGGNSDILISPEFSLSFIRVAAVTYKENKQSKIIKKEFFCFVKAENSDEKLIYSVEIIGDNLFPEKLSFSSQQETMDGEKQRIEIETVSGIIRRFAELKLAKTIIEESKDKTAIIIDGSIAAKSKEELKLIEELVNLAREKHISIGFLSKTCRLLTQNASSLNSALNELGPKSSWYYYPVFKVSNLNFKGDMYFVKLNQKSKYVFRLEIAAYNSSEYISLLAANSSDPIFYGYPYALLQADRTARVSNKETEYLKTVFLAKIKNKEKLSYLLSNLDAHDILDKIS